jgi:hypothetical protein
MSEGDPITDFAEQGSAAWLRERAGKITASRFQHVIAKLKNGNPAQKREDYLWELVVERLTGAASDHFTSTAMQWGTDNEEGAERAYAARTGAIVERAGFVLHPSMEGVGGSPDGLIRNDGGIEIKCPFNSAIHLRTILDGMPEEHKPQVQGLMWITDRAWWDFVSHDPRLPEPLDTYIQRIPRDPEFIAMMAREVVAFRADVDAMLARLRA